MALPSFEQFVDDPSVRADVTDALSLAIYDEKQSLHEHEPEGTYKPVPPELILRDSHCTLAAYALRELFGGHESSLEMILVKSIKAPRARTEQQFVGHVMLRQENTPEHLIIDPTYAQFYKYVGVTPQRVERGLVDPAVYPSERIAVYPERAAEEMVRIISTHAHMLDGILPVLPATPQHPDVDSLRGASYGAMNEVYRDIWEGCFEPQTILVGSRFGFSAARIANSLIDQFST